MTTLYRGSVKDVIGPFPLGEYSGLVFDYSDSFSVFDWGKMPDLLTGKGEALAVMAADIFERLASPDAWKDYSKTSDALLLRKGNRFGSHFNEIGEELQSKGLRTHYLGVIEKTPAAALDGPVTAKSIAQVYSPVRKLFVKQVSVAKPLLPSILGRTVPDYTPTRTSPFPRLIPLEVVFRMGTPAGSSLLERAERDPGYLASLGYGELNVHPGAQWDFPLLELFTKLESTDRWVSFSEALAISSLPAETLQDVLLKSMWVAGILKYWFAKMGLELADGKLEWAVTADGSSMLVDAIGPDELRVLKDGMQLSKEFLRGFYRKSRWFESVERAKSHAKKLGSSDWKRWVQETPPPLPPPYREAAEQVYASITNDFCGRKWFEGAWGVEKVAERLRTL